MPRVPTYDTPQVEDRPVAGVRQSSIATPGFMAEASAPQMRMAQALTSAGGSVSNIAVQMQERENADMLFRAETALRDDYLKYEANVRDTRKGQQAWGLTGETEKWFADQEKKHSDVLGNDVQRRLFAQSLTKLRQSAMGAISAFESGERRRSLEESASASISTAISTAAQQAVDWYARDPRQAARPPANAATTVGADGTPVEMTAARDPIAGFRSDILKRVQVVSDLNGWSPERRAAEEEKQLTNLHSQVIQNLAIKHPGKAKEYYEANKTEIAGTAYDGIERALKEGTAREVAQTFADSVQERKLGMEEALTEARKKYSGDEETAVVSEIKSRFAEANAATNLKQTQAADDAWKVISAGGGRAQIPLTTWNGLKGQDQRHILDYLEAKNKKAEGQDKDDLMNLDIVERLIEQGDITDRAGLAKYDAFFSKSTLKTLANKIDKRGVVPPADIRRVFEERKGEKVNVGKMSEGDRTEWMAFQDYILQNVRETRRPEDIDAFADRWFMKGYGKNDSLFTNDPNTYGEARAKGRSDFRISTPESAQASTDAALALLERSGVPIPKDRAGARDEFYTNHALDAQRWAAAHSVSASPDLMAAYALLKQNRKPITPANLQYVMQQFGKQTSNVDQIPR